MAEDLRHRVITLVRRAQQLPYRWPCPPDADSARRDQAGSCASKHALLAEELEGAGLETQPLLVVGPLVPDPVVADERFAGGRGLVEVHECLTAVTPWAGPVRIDVTWDPPLVRSGLPGTLDWDGSGDMALAVAARGPGWAVPRPSLRAAKEALRSRLYGAGERERRDRILAELAEYFDELRTRLSRPGSSPGPTP